MMLLFLLLNACESERPSYVYEEHSDILRVEIEQIFMHERDRYTIWAKPSSPGPLDVIETHRWSCEWTCDERPETIVFLDAIEPWALLKDQCTPSSGRGCKSYFLLELHLNNSQQIQGAGWDHGKFGRGTTVPLLQEGK